MTPTWGGRRAQRLTRAVLAEHGAVCVVCGGVATTADHVLPRSRGGSDALENLQPMCRTCNSRKGNRLGPGPPRARDDRGWFLPITTDADETTTPPVSKP